MAARPFSSIDRVRGASPSSGPRLTAFAVGLFLRFQCDSNGWFFTLFQLPLPRFSAGEVGRRVCRSCLRDKRDARVRVLRAPLVSEETRIFADEFGCVLSFEVPRGARRTTARDARSGFVFAVWHCGRHRNPELRSLSGSSRFSLRSQPRNSRRAISPEQRGRQIQTGESGE
jgi:hypothetical protein